MVKQKKVVVEKSRWWIWLVVALAVIGAIGVYFLLTGDGASSFPQPPMLPA